MGTILAAMLDECNKMWFRIEYCSRRREKRRRKERRKELHGVFMSRLARLLHFVGIYVQRMIGERQV
jgi:hypothetical protein